MCGIPVSGFSVTEHFRKTVVIFFCDLVGSTSLGEELDPEALRGIMDAYFGMVAGVVAEHGGAIEKYIGDAVMAVFGVPLGHEDDCLRALRTAADIKTQLTELNGRLESVHGIRLRVRTGIHCGEVVVSYRSDGDFVVTGDPVNTAARLEQGAAPDECLVSEPVRFMAKHAASFEPVAPLHAKGKAEPLRAWRLDALISPGNLKAATQAPMVGRHAQLSALRAAHTALASGTRFVTVRGAAGIGKTRLVQEFSSSTRGIEVLIGRCTSYGRGAALSPIAEMLHQIGGTSWEDEVGMLLRSSADGPIVTNTLAIATGRTPGTTSEMEVAWAVRRVLEEAGRKVVIVWEDFHLAEPSLLDLVGTVADQLRRAVLFIVVTRSETPAIESRPDNETILLTPLNFAESVDLATSLQPDVVAHSSQHSTLLEEVARISEGVPMYVEQLLATVGQVPHGAGPQVPISIQAMLESQLDCLDITERALLHRAAVIGRDFWFDCLGAIEPEHDRDRLDATLGRLRERKIVAESEHSREDWETYRFSQPLMREATYRSSPKARRVSWHQAVAEWLSLASNAPGCTAVVGDHLASAADLLEEIRGDTGTVLDLRAKSGERFAAAARETASRGDMAGTLPLLERAGELLPVESPLRHEVWLRIADCHFHLTGPGAARAALDAVSGQVPADPHWSMLAKVQQDILNVQSDPSCRDRVTETAQTALAYFRRMGDALGECRAHQLQAYLHAVSGQRREAVTSLRAAAQCAQKSGDESAALQMLANCCEMEVWSETPVAEAIARCNTVLTSACGDRVRALSAMASLSVLRAFAGDFAAARATSRAARQIAADLRLRRAEAALALHAGLAELYAGDYAAAATVTASGISYFQQIQDELPTHTLILLLARIQIEAGHVDEGGRIATELVGRATGMSPASQLVTRQIRARALASDGDLITALDMAEACVTEAGLTDDLVGRGDALLDLAEIAYLADQRSYAADRARAAAECYRRKGARHLLARAETRVAHMSASPG